MVLSHIVPETESISRPLNIIFICEAIRVAGLKVIGMPEEKRGTSFHGLYSRIGGIHFTVTGSANHILLTTETQRSSITRFICIDVHLVLTGIQVADKAGGCIGGGIEIGAVVGIPVRSFHECSIYFEGPFRIECSR